jgi:HlyD family secretion protein
VVNVDNPEEVLLPGMTAYVNIAVQKREGRAAGAQRRAALQACRSSRQESWALKTTDRSIGADAGIGRRRRGALRKALDKGKKRDGQSGTVHVLAGDEIKPVSVQLGITDNRNTEIVGGELKEGERVVTGENSNGVKPPSAIGRHADVLMNADK